MSRVFSVFLLVVVALASSQVSAKPANWPIPLFPRPKETTWLGKAVPISANKVAIVYGAKASEPDKYAAETLQKNIKKRFGQNWPIVCETGNLKSFSTLIVLGQRSTSKLADSVCRGWKVKLTKDSPGHDGYVIQVGHYGKQTIALVGGSVPRGVVYGQDTLFQMLRMQNGQMVVYPAKIRDWPSIPWRGRPHAGIGGYEPPFMYDAFAQGRVNWIDLRYGGGIYGTPPGVELDVAKIKNVIHEGHRRGFFIFGTVDCAVTKDKYDAVIKTFEEYIKLGADGMYISIDDPGKDSRIGTSVELLKRIVELGKKYGITGSKLAMVPGKESYLEINTATNHKVGHIPGMEKVLLFQTQPPSAENLKKTLDCGFTIPPAWWLNWPRPRGGFTHGGNANRRADGGRPYMYLSPLSEGWWGPTWDQIKDAGTQCSGTMMWGASIWGPEYTACVLNMWAWDPKQHDWQEERARIYDIVYGPDMVETAFKFDNLLEKVRSMFITLPDATGANPSKLWAWPPVLRNPLDREEVNSILASMEEPLKKLEAGAAKTSLLDADQLGKIYLEPMRYECETAKIVANLISPDYWWPTHEQRILMAVKNGNIEQARVWQEEAVKRALSEAKQIDAVLKPRLLDIDSEKFWASKLTPIAEAHYVTRPINFNGDLSDPLWQQAPKIGNFANGREGPDPENQTEAQLLYDDNALYVGMTCYESTMNKLLLLHTKRESEVWQDDSAEIWLNTDCLLYPHYQFIANANGVQYDAGRPVGGDISSSWNGEWEVKTAKAGDRWTIEFKIPFKTLGLDVVPKGKIWMCNFARTDHANNMLETQGFHEVIIGSYGNDPRGLLKDVRKFRPIWFK